MYDVIVTLSLDPNSIGENKRKSGERRIFSEYDGDLKGVFCKGYYNLTFKKRKQGRLRRDFSYAFARKEQIECCFNQTKEVEDTNRNSGTRTSLLHKSNENTGKRGKNQLLFYTL